MIASGQSQKNRIPLLFLLWSLVKGINLVMGECVTTIAGPSFVIHMAFSYRSDSALTMPKASSSQPKTPVSASKSQTDASKRQLPVWMSANGPRANTSKPPAAKKKKSIF